MEMNIETLPPCKIACIRRTGPYGPGNAQAMEDLKTLAASSGLLNDASVILGIARDDSQTTQPENCRYDACLVVSDGSGLYGDAVIHGTLAGGKYAVFTIAHTAEAVQKAWNEIFPELARLGHGIDAARPVIERYAAAMVKNHLCEICVPVY